MSFSRGCGDGVGVEATGGGRGVIATGGGEEGGAVGAVGAACGAPDAVGPAAAISDGEHPNTERSNGDVCEFTTKPCIATFSGPPPPTTKTPNPRATPGELWTVPPNFAEFLIKTSRASLDFRRPPR